MEYQRALELEPRDWETARLVSGLQMQLGQPELALEQLVRVADGLRDEGRLAEAAQAYEEVLNFGAKPASQAADSTASGNLDDVFAQFRREAADSLDEAQSDAQLMSGEALLVAGRTDEGIEALKLATRAPRLRFRAAALVARAYRSRGDRQSAIEWFERAAEAPSPDHAAAQALLYDLADALESMGEHSRALAIFLELATEASSYKDVLTRIKRLTTRETRG